MNLHSFRSLLPALALASFASCNDNSESSANTSDTLGAATAQSAAAPEKEWVTLFDGRTFTGWHGFNKKGDSIKNWAIEDSSLVCLGAAKDAHGGDIVTDASYGNFELVWDWKVTKGANSGVMYHVIESSQYKAPYETGPEYQMIDDIGFPEKLEEWQKTGADYAMATPPTKTVKPVGEWNSSKIIFNNGHVEHWLNGQKILEFETGSPEWKQKKETGKWKDYPGYGTAQSGPIALQDHGNKVYFKNIRIREL